MRLPLEKRGQPLREIRLRCPGLPQVDLGDWDGRNLFAKTLGTAL